MQPPDLIRLGSATINGHLDAQPPAADHHEIHADRNLIVRLPFEYRGHGTDWDSCTIDLQTRLDGGAPREAHWNESSRGWFHPEEWGFISIDYAALPPGHHELEYEVTVRRDHGPRGRPDGNVHEESIQRGTLQLECIPARKPALFA